MKNFPTFALLLLSFSFNCSNLKHIKRTVIYTILREITIQICSCSEQLIKFNYSNEPRFSQYCMYCGFYLFLMHTRLFNDNFMKLFPASRFRPIHTTASIITIWDIFGLYYYVIAFTNYFIITVFNEVVYKGKIETSRERKKCRKETFLFLQMNQNFRLQQQSHSLEK